MFRSACIACITYYVRVLCIMYSVYIGGVYWWCVLVCIVRSVLCDLVLCDLVRVSGPMPPHSQCRSKAREIVNAHSWNIVEHYSIYTTGPLNV